MIRLVTFFKSASTGVVGTQSKTAQAGVLAGVDNAVPASGHPRWNRVLGFSLALALLLALACFPASRAQAAGTDKIKNYTIDILPQEDGSLLDTYAVNWCVISNSAGPLTWFTVGMPNEQYQVMGSSGDVASVVPANEGFNYMIRINLPREVNAGECVNATVTVHQYGMANLDSSTNEISMQFTPGWFNDVPVDQLQVTWHLPSTAAQLKSLDPKPARQDASQAVWESALQPGEKYPITVVYDRAAFPGFTPGQAAPAQTSVSFPTDSGQSIPIPTTSENNSPSIAPALGLGIPLTATSCICMCLVALLILFVLFMFLRAFGSAGRVYRSGGWLGGYPRGGGWLGGGGGGINLGGGSGGGFTPRSGGGSGLFGGRGMSCACVSSGCACACAGGGRAGCSRKGFDVSGLFRDRREGKVQ